MELFSELYLQAATVDSGQPQTGAWGEVCGGRGGLRWGKGGFFRGRGRSGSMPAPPSQTYVEFGGVEDVASVRTPARGQQTDRALVNLTVPVRLLQRPYLSKPKEKRNPVKRAQYIPAGL